MPRILVAGATGVTGTAIVDHFADLPDWSVVAAARRDPWRTVAGVEHLRLDLGDRDACRAALAERADITHLAYAAVNENADDIVAGWADQGQIDKNVEMLRNILEPLAADGGALQHVLLVHGLKAYGSHLPHITTKLPFRETDASYKDWNFYHHQQDYVAERQRGAPWNWTILRPGGTIGLAVGGNMNWSLVLTVFAALRKEAGLNLPMPAGTSGIFEMCDSDLIAEATEWAFASPAARNEVFNITNGDVFPLHDIFPILAEEFGIPLGDPRPFDLPAELARIAPLWPALVEAHGLAAPRDLDALLGATPQIVGAWSQSMPPERRLMSGISSTIKLRKAGFTGCADSADVVRKYIRCYRALGIVP
ncbi:NAD-dependent epimerase/dehydratase family protein [Flavisphingomonas formosensis]|uniref:NAD-dependent epimerase/dehydratase family protein n=1 Tax=Flavisphingomonas formosensis TaxID=861534 RepID=UPI0012F7BC58|nr:NAD-dependent epimerase/dehydratase family protein [Sphingomonas formosensis]